MLIWLKNQGKVRYRTFQLRSLDGNHCFIVRYRAGEDLGLDMHTDDSDITFNLALGLDFEGAKLQFCGMMGSTDHRQASINYSHVRGRAVIHYGKQRHGADDITSGERLNMILWNHSSAFRASDESKTAYTYEGSNSKLDRICV